MSDDRRRITVHAETFAALAADKRDGETWDARLRRLLAALEDDGGARVVTLADEDKREIARAAADELEQRLR
jgi:hypothetical protein